MRGLTLQLITFTFVCIVGCVSSSSTADDLYFELDGMKRKIPGVNWFDLRLVPAEHLPEYATNAVYLARGAKGQLHFRVFDETGRRVVDKGEPEVTDQERTLESLKRELAGHWNEENLTDEQKARLVRAVTLMFGLIAENFVAASSEAERDSIMAGNLLHQVRELIFSNANITRDSLRVKAKAEPIAVYLLDKSGMTRDEVRNYLEIEKQALLRIKEAYRAEPIEPDKLMDELMTLFPDEQAIDDRLSEIGNMKRPEWGMFGDQAIALARLMVFCESELGVEDVNEGQARRYRDDYEEVFGIAITEASATVGVRLDDCSRRMDEFLLSLIESRRLVIYSAAIKTVIIERLAPAYEAPP